MLEMDKYFLVSVKLCLLDVYGNVADLNMNKQRSKIYENISI